MNENKRFIEESIRTKKRSNDDECSHAVKRKELNSNKSIVPATIRFDFVENSIETDDESLLMKKLSTMKQQLNNVKSLLSDKDIVDWNRYTAYINTSSSIVPYLREKLHIEVATQAWPKMYEMLATFNLISSVDKHKKLTTLHLCEAPGAFISALNHYLVTREENQHIEWEWFAQTLNPYYEHDETTEAMLVDDDRLIYHTIDNNHWNFGIDNSGNIMNEENINYYVTHFQTMDIQLITADGSYDVQSNPGEQELLVYPLLKIEVYVALSCLMTHGNFVVKIFTTFEQATIDLIYVLYRTFRQISMFKPQTSKKGNSEVYVICIDFNREKFTNCFSDNFQVNSQPCSLSFLNQIVKCSELFQSHQIQTITNNVHHFHNRARKFNKKLNKIKENMLNKFLDQCQIRELLPNDRHLLKSDLESKHILQYNNRMARTGTFNNQHQIDFDEIRNKILNGFFCLTCSNNKINELCFICHQLSEIIINPSLTMSNLYIGELIANKQTIIDYIHGKKTRAIRNSCFCHRYLLELCTQIDLYQVPSNEISIDWNSIRSASSIEIPNEEFEQLQQFTNNYEMNLQYKNGVYYIQSAPILTRLQASVIYILTRTFEKTSVYVIPSPSAHLLIIFETSSKNINDEYKTMSSSDNSTLLQFVHTYQLLDQQFAFNLIQANNICLQLKYVL